MPNCFDMYPFLCSKCRSTISCCTVRYGTVPVLTRESALTCVLISTYRSFDFIYKIWSNATSYICILYWWLSLMHVFRILYFIDAWFFIIATNFYVCAGVRCLTLYAQVHKYEGNRGAEGQMQKLKGVFSYTKLSFISLLARKNSHACSIISLFCNVRWCYVACVILPQRCQD